MLLHTAAAFISNEPLTEMERSCGRQLYTEGEEERKGLDAEDEEGGEDNDEDRRARSRFGIAWDRLLGVVLIILDLGVMWRVGIDRVCSSVIWGALFESDNDPSGVSYWMLPSCRVSASAVGGL